MDGECCDLDHPREEPESPTGQHSPAPYQNPTAHEPLLSVASSGRGPSQPRPVADQYQPAQSMQYGSTSKAGPGQSAPLAGYPGSLSGSYGGVFIAGQHPSGFTTQASSYNEAADVTPFQQSMGCYRDGAGLLYNSQGQRVDENCQVIQPTASSIPQPSPTSGSSEQSFQTAPSHNSRSSGGASHAGSGRGGQKEKQKTH